MNFSPQVGLRRIIVMQASNIDYANIALAESTQLVGGNGRGKTTLINVLQFLYVPNETRWFFNGHLPPATKEHYFPRDKQPYARVVFEVMTPTGPAIVGVRRKSVASTELEHFFATGPFHRPDFYSETERCRPWEDVKPRLVLKNYAVISDLQACLTGSGEINLGLVPMRKGDGGDLFDVKFITPFMRLFRLSAFDQKAMQRVLIDYARLTPEQSEFNARATLERELGVALRNADQVEQLEAAAKDISRAEDTYEGVVREGTWLISSYGVIVRRRKLAVDEIAAAAKPVKDRLETIESELVDLRLRKVAAESVRESVQRDYNRIQAEIDLVAQDEQTLADSGYIHEFAIQSSGNLASEIAKLQQRIGAAESRPLSELQVEFAELTEELEKLKGELERFSSLLITHLRGQLQDEEIASVFSLLDPGLLRRIEGRDVFIDDVPALASRLRDLASRIDNSKYYRDDTVRVRLDLTNAKKTVREVGSLEELGRAIEAKTKAVSVAEKALTEARDVAALKARIEMLGKELAPVQAAISHYNALQLRIQRLPERREKLALFYEKLTQAVSVVKDLVEGETTKTSEKRISQEALNAKTQELSDLQALLLELPQPAILDEPSSPVPISDTVPLLQLVKDYRSRHATHQQLLSLWETLTHALELGLGERYTSAGATPNKRLQVLRTQLDLVPHAREKAEKELHALLAAAGQYFAQLRMGLHEVKRAADKINDAFRKMRLSNIESVSCTVEDVADALRDVDELAELDPGFSLFGNSARTKQLIQQFRTRWETHPVYRVEDLFLVRLVIKNPGSKPVAYDQFNERTGSNGQVIALKVFVNLMVLSIQLNPKRQARIPFYIDEIASLDPVNFRSIQQFATEHGFIALYAAPETKIGMSRYYPLRAQGGRLIVDDSCAQDARWHDSVRDENESISV